MARGGGTFTVQNKTLPGAYINFISKSRALGNLGERGIVALPFTMNWGAENEIINLTFEELQANSLKILGYSYTSDKLYFLREVFSGATECKLYRVSGGAKASKTDSGFLVITNEDVGTGLGKQTVVLKGVNLDSIILTKLDVGNTELDEDISFTFNGADMMNKFNSAVGENL